MTLVLELDVRRAYVLFVVASALSGVVVGSIFWLAVQVWHCQG